MQVTINVPEQLAELAQARGVPVETYVEEVLAQQASQLPAKQNSETAREAVEYILNFRKTHTLAGLNIKDLINEGRKY
jgi:post-segregation antitoxin (ccd killing protein)